MTYSQGDIIIVPFPFTNQTQSKVRPAVVVSNDNYIFDDLVIIPISSTPVDTELGIQILNEHVTVNLRPKPDGSPNYVHCNKLATIEQTLILKRISSLTDIAKEEIYERIQNILTIFS